MTAQKNGYYFKYQKEALEHKELQLLGIVEELIDNVIQTILSLYF